MNSKVHVTSERPVVCGRAMRRRSENAVRRSGACYAVPSEEGKTATMKFEPMAPKKILILGGTGRVGSSTAVSLLQRTPNHQVTLASRYQASYDATVERRPELKSTKFCSVDINDAAALQVRTMPRFKLACEIHDICWDSAVTLGESVM